MGPISPDTFGGDVYVSDMGTWNLRRLVANYRTMPSADLRRRWRVRIPGDVFALGGAIGSGATLVTRIRPAVAYDSRGGLIR